VDKDQLIPVLEQTTAETIISIIIVLIPFILIEVCIVSTSQPNVGSFSDIVEFLIIRIPVARKE
jgi:hypothetical protein